MAKINYGAWVDPNKYYPVSYTIKQDGTKVIENTFLKGADMTENQIKELLESSQKFVEEAKSRVINTEPVISNKSMSIEALNEKWNGELDRWRKACAENALFHTQEERQKAFCFSQAIASFLADIKLLHLAEIEFKKLTIDNDVRLKIIDILNSKLSALSTIGEEDVDGIEDAADALIEWFLDIVNPQIIGAEKTDYEQSEERKQIYDEVRNLIESQLKIGDELRYGNWNKAGLVLSQLDLDFKFLSHVLKSKQTHIIKQ